MKSSQYIELIRQFRKEGFSKKSELGFTSSMVMREDKVIFINKKGYESLYKIINLIKSDIGNKGFIDNKNLEKLFYDNCFNLLINENIQVQEIKEGISKLFTKIEEIINIEYTVIIPVSGLKVRGDFNVLDYKIISKNRLKKTFPKEVYKQLFESGDSFAITDDLGEPRSLMNWHRENLDAALNLVRLYIPYFWHHNYEVEISVIDKDFVTTTSCFVINRQGKRQGRISVARRPHKFNIDIKRTSTEKFSQRKTMKLLNYDKLNGLLRMNTKFSKVLINSLEWAGKYTKEKRIRNKFLYLIFALEGIFTNESNNYSSITAAVSEKIAFLIGSTKDDRIKVFKFVKKMYNKRGSIVHGSDVNIQSSEMINLYQILLECFYNIADYIEKYNIETPDEFNNIMTEKKFE